jgi:hypothetical protein
MSKSKKSKCLIIFFISDFINQEILEDQEDPKEPGHFDYKYIKSKAGPLYKTQGEDNTLLVKGEPGSRTIVK